LSGMVLDFQRTSTSGPPSPQVDTVEARFVGPLPEISKDVGFRIFRRPARAQHFGLRAAILAETVDPDPVFGRVDQPADPAAERVEQRLDLVADERIGRRDLNGLRPSPPSPLPAAHPDLRERGVKTARALPHQSLHPLKFKREAERMDADFGRHHSPLSRGSGRAAGRGDGGEG
jgi:hypothetical protein